MNVRKPRYDSKVYAQRGDEIYDRCVKPRLRPEDKDKFVLIDIESEDFELDSSELAGSERLLTRHPDAQIWIARVGHRSAYRIGRRSKSGDAK